MICMANLISVQHLEQISAPLERRFAARLSVLVVVARSLPATESHVIIICHVDVEDEFTFDGIELSGSEHLVIFGLFEKKSRRGVETRQILL